EALERANILVVERPHLQAPDGECGDDLALDDDRDAGHRADTDVADRRYAGRIGGVVLPRDRPARADDRTHDAALARRMHADDALAGARASDDPELVAPALVDRRVIRVDQQQRAAGDR